MNVKRRMLLVGLGLSVLGTTPVVHANEWPTRSIRLIVPFPPGGSTDILGRATAEYLQKRLNVPVVVENLPGATGTIGTAAAARAAPDGYTLLMGSIGTVVTNHFVYEGLSFGLDSFQPIITVAETPNVVMVRPTLEVNNVSELIEYMKANPGKLNHGSPGLASSSHVSAEMFKLRAGVDAQHVPYKGSSPMLVDLIGGTLDFTIDNISSSLELIKANKLKALAVTSRTRSPLLPELPTVIESGMDDYVMAPWFCVMAPASTPDPIVRKLNVILNDMLADSSVSKVLQSYGAQPVGGTPEDLQQLMAREAETIRSLSNVVDFRSS